MSHKLPLIRFVVLLSVFSVARSGFAQAPNPPLNFGNNFFITGDYVVAGAQGMTTTFSGGYAVRTIKVPDANPGITGVKQVPAGAQIIDALLYWETVEKTGVAPGQPGSGQNGFFRSVIANGPSAPGYPIGG